MNIIVGLGNIGIQYSNTYHNLGFKVIDKLSQDWGIELDKKKYKALIGKGFVNGQQLMLVKPTTYMNNSGECVVLLKQKYKDARIIVVVDDIDLEKGKIRYREKGKSGTHNGLRSIVFYIGENFERVRIGIGRDEKRDLADYVLSNISSEDNLIFQSAINEACKLIEEKLFEKNW